MSVEDSLGTKVQDLVDRAEIVDCLNRWSVKNADARSSSLFARQERADHLDQPEHRHRIEKVQSNELLGT